MSIIGNIAGVPLFTTIQEALDWALSMGLNGYHMHNLNGKQGYMGGANHQQAAGTSITLNPVPSMSVSSGSSSGGSSGSGSGGGGY